MLGSHTPQAGCSQEGSTQKAPRKPEADMPLTTLSSLVFQNQTNPTARLNFCSKLWSPGSLSGENWATFCSSIQSSLVGTAVIGE